MKNAYLKIGLPLAALAGLGFLVAKGNTADGPLTIAQAPLFTRTVLPPLNMLVMERDHKLYYEAYNDASDLNNDGVLDVGYKPNQITYYGYYNSNVCYESQEGGTGGQMFVPVAAAGGANKKECSGRWSGDFLNYLTTSRMDALRKVLYGGYREVDTETETVLRASFTPQDAHSWGKEYGAADLARTDGYDISKYSPLGQPSAGRQHLFAVTTLSDNGIPQLRVLRNTTFRIWNWVSIERPVAGNDCFGPGNRRVNCVTASGNNVDWELVPRANYSGLTITTWKYEADLPGDTAAMNAQFVSTADQCGTGPVAEINSTSGNPFTSSGRNGCKNDNFKTKIAGQIVATEAGEYQFAVNGDDAVDVSIGGTLVASWYGGHGPNNSQDALNSHSGVIYLAAGKHDIVFRHREKDGGEAWQLYWKKPVAGGSTSMTNYALRVKACPANAVLREDVCKLYDNGTSYKPTGILHEYGETDRMYFGLLTGSYAKNTAGGVLRSNMGSFRREVNPRSGQFCLDGNCGNQKDVKGIVHTINSFRTVGFDYSNMTYGSSCGWITDRPVKAGECWMWGNPVAEMMYETLRYFGGAKQPRSEYDIGTTSTDSTTLGLSQPGWEPPYVAKADGGGEYPKCSQPTMTVLSDINPSYDFKLPGSNWGAISSTGDPASLTGLNVSTEADKVWASEGGGTRKVFIGESNGVVDNAPTPKDVSNLSTVRGLAPEEPSKQGTYYSAAVARYGANNNIGGEKKVRTYSVAMASPLPKFDFPVGAGRITFVPFAKSVAGSGVNATGNFQPTNQIVDFYVQKVANTSGAGGADEDKSINGGRPYAEFRINYEDVEQGADHDMDAIALYILSVNDKGRLDVRVQSEYAAGGIDQHMGYVISGTTQDGVYLEVCDLKDGQANGGTRDSCAGQVSYRLNTPPGKAPGYCNTSSMPGDCKGLPPTADRTFDVGTSAGAGLLRDPLWYAAKYGNDQGVTLDDKGDPTNYFLVTNPLYLRQQLTKAFDAIQNQNGNSGSIAVSGARISASSMAVIPKYGSANDAKDWVGDLEAYAVNSDASLGAKLWSVAANMSADGFKPEDRKIFTSLTPLTSTSKDRAREFKAAQLVADSSSGATKEAMAAEIFGRLGYTAASIIADFGDITPNQLVEYLRGVRTMEGTVLTTKPFRQRSNIMGDIINSAPVIATKKANYGWGGASGLSDDLRTSYATYVKGKSDSGKKEYVYVGANDGMLHAFDDQGKEIFAYVPNGVLNNMGYLANRGYQHRYYVDGKLTLADVPVSGVWSTMLVGAAGAGGRTVFGMNVSTPDEFGASDVVWELNSNSMSGTAAVGNDLGHVFGKPVVVPLQNGKWVALFGNGVNSANGTAVLFVVDVATGEVLRTIQADAGSNFDADDVAGLGHNGLMNISAIDSNWDGLTDTVYGADLYGNVWKFDLSGETAMSWDVAYKQGANVNVPLFVARNASGARQPITGAFEIAMGPGSGYMLYFGTGRYFAASDGNSKDLNTLYAVWDNGTPITTSRAALVEQEITANKSTVPPTRTISRNPVNYVVSRGWYLDLQVGDATPDGERFIGVPSIQNGQIMFTTYIPGVTVDCLTGGTNWLYRLNALTGAPSLGSVTLPPADGSVGDGDTGGISIGGDGAPSQGGGLLNPTPPQPKYCNPSDPDCNPDPPSPTKCSTVVKNAADPTKSLVMLRACGRQSWRQLQ